MLSPIDKLRESAERITGHTWHDENDLRNAYAHNWLDAAYIEACSPALILSLLSHNARLITALRVAKANLDSGTYTEAAEDIITGTLYNDQ